jgi:uncharacterized membrane protein
MGELVNCTSAIIGLLISIFSGIGAIVCFILFWLFITIPIGLGLLALSIVSGIVSLVIVLYLIFKAPFGIGKLSPWCKTMVILYILVLISSIITTSVQKDNISSGLVTSGA